MFLSVSYTQVLQNSFYTVSCNNLTQMSNQLAQQQAILYQDDTVQIYRDKVCILKYYFPIPMVKNIDMIDVQEVHLKENVDGHVWGTSPGHMNIWFALDNNRHLKKRYLQVIVRGSDVKIAFSPNDPEKVMSIIQTHSSLLWGERKIKQQQLLQPKSHIEYSAQKQRKQVVGVQNQVLVKPQTKSLGQSIKEIFNQKLEGLKNLKDTVKQKYEQGKQNAHISPNNKKEVGKQNINQSQHTTNIKTGETYKNVGQAFKEKGNQMQRQAWQNR